MLPKNPGKAEIQRLNYERYHYPCPRVQKRLHAIYIKATTAMSNNLIGAVNAITKEVITLSNTTFTAETIVAFLKQL